MELVPFNYDHFKKNRPVVTRDEMVAKFLGEDGHPKYPLSFELVNDSEPFRTYDVNGKFIDDEITLSDLMHPADPKWDTPQVTPEDTPEDREVWLRLYCALLDGSPSYNNDLNPKSKVQADWADACLAEYKKRWAKL